MYAPIFGRLQLWMLTKWQNIYVDVYRVILFLAVFCFGNFIDKNVVRADNLDLREKLATQGDN